MKTTKVNDNGFQSPESRTTIIKMNFRNLQKLHSKIIQTQILQKLGLFSKRKKLFSLKPEGELGLLNFGKPSRNPKSIKAIKISPMLISSGVHFRTLSRVLKSIKKLETLRIQGLGDFLTELMMKVGQSFKGLRNLKEICLNIEDKPFIYSLLTYQEVYLWEVSRIFRRNKKVTNVSIEIAGLFISNDCCPGSILEFLHKSPQLRVLSLKIPGFADHIHDMSVRSIIKATQDIKQLRILKLDFGQFVSNKSLCLLGDCVTTLPNLKLFEVQAFLTREITNLGVEALYSSIKSLEKLEELRIFFDSLSQRISAQSFDTLLESLISLEALRIMELMFGGIEVSSFFGNLHTLTQVKHISIHHLTSLDYLRLEHPGIEHLAIILSSKQQKFLRPLLTSITGLNCLSVTLYHNIAEQASEALADVLKELKQLKGLFLRIGTIENADQMMKIWQTIQKMTNLNSLKLDFKQGLGSSFDNKMMRGISQNLIDANLEEFELRLMFSHKVSCHSFKDFFWSLSSMRRLGCLKLDLGDQGYLDNDKFACCFEFLKKLKDLRKVDIVMFRTESNMDDDDKLIQETKEILLHLKRLTEINLALGRSLYYRSIDNSFVIHQGVIFL